FIRQAPMAFLQRQIGARDFGEDFADVVTAPSGPVNDGGAAGMIAVPAFQKGFGAFGFAEINVEALGEVGIQVPAMQMGCREAVKGKGGVRGESWEVAGRVERDFFPRTQDLIVMKGGTPVFSFSDIPLGVQAVEPSPKKIGHFKPRHFVETGARPFTASLRLL